MASFKMIHLIVLSLLLAIAAAGPPVIKTRAEIEDFKLALEKSREDDGLTLEERMEMYPLQNEWANSGKFQGDILLDDSQIQDFVDDFSSERMAYIRADSRWPHATGVYEFGPGEFNLEQQRQILGVMNALSQHTCVRFRVRNANDRSFVRITGRPTGCYAQVGFHPARTITTLNVARATPGHGCLNFVIIAHEWYHVLGFFHMQSTYNRYDYVRIHWENIREEMTLTFLCNKVEMVLHMHSIVLIILLLRTYGCLTSTVAACTMAHTFSPLTDGLRLALQGNIEQQRLRLQYNGVLGQTTRITGWDIWRLARHYNCPGAWSAEAMEKARTTALVQNEKGEIVVEKTDMPLADEFELLEDVEIFDE